MHPSYLRYVRGKNTSTARREKRYVVRVFHPRGQYPRGKVASTEALYVADDDIVFCVTHTKRWIPEDNDNDSDDVGRDNLYGVI